MTGTYKVRVKATTGASDYTLQLSYGQTSGGGGIASYSKTYGFGDTQSMFPYGTAYDPTDHTIIVGDYWNFRVQRYSDAGAHIATYTQPRRRRRGRALRRHRRPERHVGLRQR